MAIQRLRLHVSDLQAELRQDHLTQILLDLVSLVPTITKAMAATLDRPGDNRQVCEYLVMPEASCGQKALC